MSDDVVREAAGRADDQEGRQAHEDSQHRAQDDGGYRLDRERVAQECARLLALQEEWGGVIGDQWA